MTPQELKASILQLAIQGKLVEQRPEEGTGAELLEKILAAKNAKSAKNNLTRRRGERGVPSSHVSHLESSHAVEKISAHATLPSKKISANSASPREEIPDSEKPFDIPESWVWVRLGEVVDILDSMRRPITKADRKPGPYPYYGASCIQDYVADYIFDEPLVLLGEDGAKWGRGDNSAYRISGKTWVNNHAHVLRPLGGVKHDYLVHVLCISDLTSFVTGTTVPKLNQARMCGIPIPLPPLAEQKRIVAKIEELLPYIDRYEKAWSKLEDFNKRFPGDMQKSLLQMAIQGKLVDQRPEEGTGEELYRQIQSEKQRLIKSGKIKKEKPLPEITPDEIPFDIPESWKWVSFLSVVDIATNLVSPTGHENDRHIAPDNIEKGTGRLLDSRTVAEDKVVSSNHQFFKGQLIYSKIRPLLRKVVIAPFDGLCSADMYPLNTKLDASFLLFYMLSDAFNLQIAKAMSSRVKMPKINQEELSRVLLPLPPLAEQKRIVAKLKELLPLCELLK